MELVKSIIDEKGSNVNVGLVVDTEVEKIEDKKEEKINEDDIVSLFDEGYVIMFGNMKEMLKQAQNMKSQMKKIKKS